MKSYTTQSCKITHTHKHTKVLDQSQINNDISYDLNSFPQNIRQLYINFGWCVVWVCNKDLRQKMTKIQLTKWEDWTNQPYENLEKGSNKRKKEQFVQNIWIKI
jgi:hypothetical protein